MISDTKTIIFLGNGRCFHTLDWFRSAQRPRPENPPVLVTASVENESWNVKTILAYEEELYLLEQRLPKNDLERRQAEKIMLPPQRALS